MCQKTKTRSSTSNAVCLTKQSFEPGSVNISRKSLVRTKRTNLTSWLLNRWSKWGTPKPTITKSVDTQMSMFCMQKSKSQIKFKNPKSKTMIPSTRWWIKITRTNTWDSLMMKKKVMTMKIMLFWNKLSQRLSLKVRTKTSNNKLKNKNNNQLAVLN